MKQLTFDLLPPPAPTLQNFFAGRNAELLQVLQQIANGSSRERFVFLWGAPGAGKSHLLRALADEADGAYLACEAHSRLDDALGHRAVVALDDADALGDSGAHDLFNLYNRIRAGSGTLVVSAAAAPAQLRLREDVKTRLGWGLVFEVHALGDAEKVAALKRRARERGFALADDVVNYLLTHWRRDMPSLLAALDALDRYSLEAKRPVTLPLLKQAITSSTGMSLLHNSQPPRATSQATERDGT